VVFKLPLIKKGGDLVQGKVTRKQNKSQNYVANIIGLPAFVNANVMVWSDNINKGGLKYNNYVGLF
jgi:hypothetical protein